MNRKSLAEHLQECLSGFDAGLSPEQCLSVFPEQRAELEPLFRHALSLRVAFAASPKPEYRERAKEKLLFAAGKDISAALVQEPDPEFVDKTRQRLVTAGGQAVHEALRAVPPPRLPFWVNARRRLLEAAQEPAYRTSRRQPMTLALRTGLTAAVVVLALSVAGLAYITNSDNAPASFSAQYELLDQDLSELEAQAEAGIDIEPAVLNELSQRTSSLVAQIDEAQLDPVVDKLPEIIQRQREIVLATAEDTLSPALQEAELQLNEAEENVEEIRLAAAGVGGLDSSQSGDEPTATFSNGVNPTLTPIPTPVPAPGLAANEVKVSALPSDATYGLSWQSLETVNLYVVVPSSWTVTVPDIDSTGLGTLEVSAIRVDGPSVIILIQVDSGGVHAVIGDVIIVLRTEGAGGELITADELVAAGPLALELTHVVETIVFTGLPATSDSN